MELGRRLGMGWEALAHPLYKDEGVRSFPSFARWCCKTAQFGLLVSLSNSNSSLSGKAGGGTIWAHLRSRNLKEPYTATHTTRVCLGAQTIIRPYHWPGKGPLPFCPKREKRVNLFNLTVASNDFRTIRKYSIHEKYFRQTQVENSVGPI